MKKPFKIAYLEMAQKIAEDRSSDSFTRVGAVGTNDRGEIISCSYNGTKAGYKFSFDETSPGNRDKKNLLYAHAEENLIIRNTRDEIVSVYLTHSPCKNCAKLLSIFGVQYVYFIEEYHREQDYKFIFEEYGVVYEQVKI